MKTFGDLETSKRYLDYFWWQDNLKTYVLFLWLTGSVSYNECKNYFVNLNYTNSS